jgi:hypothetical protein
MGFSHLNLSFKLVWFFFIFFSLNVSFVSVFSETLDDSYNSSGVQALKAVRDGMRNLAVKVYLYETVLFEPSKYFEIGLDNVDSVGDTPSSINLNVSSDSVWSVPVRSNLPGNDIIFIPSQLFDITFVVSDGLIYSLSDVTAVVTFENFGTVDIPVDLSYTLFDSTNKIIFTESDSIVVGTMNSILKEFDRPEVSLIEGDYRLVLETVYGDNVRDSFSSDFKVSSEYISFFGGFMIYVYGFLLFVVIFFIFLFFYRTFFLKSDAVENFDNVQEKLTYSQNEVYKSTFGVKTTSGVEPKLNGGLVTSGLSVVKDSKLTNDSDEHEFEGGNKLINDDF